jgi:carbon monoxide dehydrogenase subunit G
MTVRMDAVPDGTALSYQGEAMVGGTVAGVGQRMLSGVATFIMNQFFGNIGKEAQQSNA